MDMQQKGFYFKADDSLASNEGELLAGTNEGIRYSLLFGKVFTGSDLEIEAGQAKDESGEKPEGATEGTEKSAGDDGTRPAEDTGDGEDKSGDAAADSDSDDTSLNKSRYVFILASFDESLLGARPEAPVKPEPPPEAAAPENNPAGTQGTQEQPGDADAAGGDAPSTPKDDATAADGPNKTESAPADAAAAQPKSEGGEETKPEVAAEPKPEEKKPDPKAEYEAALAKYNADQAQFEQKSKDYDGKIEKGKKLAEELQLRFANWYYVIDAAQFDKLHVQRDDLVEPKEPPKTTTPAAGEASPGSGAAATSPPAPPTVEAGETPKTDDAVKPAGSPAEKTPPGGADPPKADGDAAAPAADNKTDAPAGEKPPESPGEAPPAGGAKPPADNDSPPGQAP
jgi:hypothetical protein